MTFRSALSLAAAVSALAALSSPALAINYDCSKAGNANKTACKGTAKPAKLVAAAKPATKPAAVPAVSHMASARPTTKLAPATVAYTQKNGKVVHYDCSKTGNQSKTACKR